MPTYEYLCRSCGDRFSLVLHVSEHDRKDIKCPRCGSTEVVQQMQPFFAKTAKKS